MVKLQNKYPVLVFLVMCFMFSSCHKNQSASTDYSEEKNLYSKTIGDYHFTLKPFSSEKLAAINYENKNLSATEKDSVLKEYNELTCFVFEIDIDGFKEAITDYEKPGEESSYDKKVNYYLFDMQQSLKIKNEEGSEQPCVVYYYERINMIAQTNRFIIGFKRPKGNTAVIEYSNPYLNCGKVNFSINEQHLALK